MTPSKSKTSLKIHQVAPPMSVVYGKLYIPKSNSATADISLSTAMPGELHSSYAYNFLLITSIKFKLSFTV